MADRKPMSVDEFDLMVRAIHRDWKCNSKCVNVHSNESLFYKGTEIHIYVSNNFIWPTIHQIEFDVKKPIGFFNRKKKQKLDLAIQLVNEMRGFMPTSSVEEIICQHIPLARHIIAERALIGDHKSKS